MRLFLCFATLILMTGCTTTAANANSKTKTTAAQAQTQSQAQSSLAKPSELVLNVELAKRFAAEHKVEINTYRFKYIGDERKYMAPLIRTRDGGYLLVGTHNDFPRGTFVPRKSTPKVIKLDASGKVIWERSLFTKEFVTLEAIGALELDQGYIIHVGAYINLNAGAIARYHRIDDQGKEVWHLQLRGNGGLNTPIPQRAKIVGDKIVIDGSIFVNNWETKNAWYGEVSLQGKLLVDTVGRVMKANELYD